MGETPTPRDRAAVRIFPPLVPVATILVGIGVARLWPVDLGYGSAASHLATAGSVLIVLGLALIIWAALDFKRTGQDPNPFKPTPEIVASGPFRLTRNPMYLGMILICLGFAVRLSNLWIFLLTPLAVWLLQKWVILPEEAYLEGKFGDTYLDYKHSVRRWI